MLMLGLVRKSTLLDDDPRCTCKSRTPRPALTAPRHDVTSAALSGLAAQKHEQGFGATSTQPVCMLDDATVHIEDAASCAYRYTTATRLDMYSTMHRCVEWPCFTEAKSVPPSRDYILKIGRGRERGRERTFRRKCRSPGRHRANIEGSASDGRGPRGNCELGTDCADCARRSGGRDASGEVKRPL
jgi:hypothetical protein